MGGSSDGALLYRFLFGFACTMWQAALSAPGAAVTPHYGQQYYEPYPPPTAYGAAPYVAYAQGTTGAGSADGGTSSGPADQNGHDGRHETLRPLLVQPETIRVEPKIPLTMGTTTAQMSTRAETRTAEKTTTIPQTITTERSITTPQTTTTLPWTTTVKTTTMPETTITEKTTATTPSTTEKTTTTPETTATEEVTVILQTGSTAQVSSEGTTEAGTPTAIDTSELTSPQAEVMRRQPLLCTMGTKTDKAQMFPEDGLCDYLFHDSVYKSGISTFDPPDEVDTDLNIFVEQREEYVVTEFGIGFGFKNAAYLTTLISKSQTSDSPFMVGYFWRQRIYHFGVLDAPTKDVKEDSVKAALDLLKVVNDLSDFQRLQKHSCFMVFSGLVPDETWAKFYADTFSSTVWPHLFIGLGHYENGDNTFADCRIMPPTLLTRPLQELAVRSFEKLETTGSPPLWVVSVTMKGRWTVRAEGEKPRFLSQCLNDPDAESFGSVAQVCEDSDFEQAEIDPYLYSTLAHNINDSRVFSFDNEAALKEKLCRLKAGHTSTSFGIAAFDLEYEDFSNVCFFDNSHGAFSRLKMLRKLTDFFAANFTGPQYEAACLNLAR